MLDDNPVVKERTMGLAALAAIGLGGAVAVDLIVTGGFDFGPSRAPYDRERPSAYVQMADAAQYVGDSVRSLAFSRPPDTPASEERLAGENDGSAPSTTATEDAGGDLYDQIAALYSDSETMVEAPTYDEPAYEEALSLDEQDAAAYEEPAYEDESATVYEDKAASGDGSESPW